MTDPALTLIQITLVLYMLGMVMFFARLAFSWAPLTQLALWFTTAGLALHVIAFGLRWYEAGRYPLANMYEYSVLVSGVAVLVFLVVSRRSAALAAGGPVLALAVAWMGFGLVVYVPPGPLIAILRSYWREVHVSAMATSSAILTVAFGVTILHLVRTWADARLARVESDIPPGSLGIAARPTVSALPRAWASASATALPSASFLDQLAYRLVMLGLPIWIFGTMMGALWAEEAWGHYWEWDPKETWALITAIVYSVYWHARATHGWRGRRAAWLMTAGFVALVITYYFVNLFIVGRHSYAR